MDWYAKEQYKDNAQDIVNSSWFNGSKVVDNLGNPLKVYHGTRFNFDEFDLDKCAMGIIWFSSDESRILSGESGACGTSFIKEAYLSIKNPAGWDAYDKYGIGELKSQGFDGIFLDDNYVVFETSQIKVI